MLSGPRNEPRLRTYRVPLRTCVLSYYAVCPVPLYLVEPARFCLRGGVYALFGQEAALRDVTRRRWSVGGVRLVVAGRRARLDGPSPTSEGGNSKAGRSRDFARKIGGRSGDELNPSINVPPFAGGPRNPT